MNNVPDSKITAVNGIDLPNELISVIKDFSFYDKNSLSYIKKLSSFKRPINDTIKSAYSRNNPHIFEDSIEDPNADEHWCFGFDDDDNRKIAITM